MAKGGQVSLWVAADGGMVFEPQHYDHGNFRLEFSKHLLFTIYILR